MTVDALALSRVEPGYRHVLRIRALLFWLPLSVAAIVVFGIAIIVRK